MEEYGVKKNSLGRMIAVLIMLCIVIVGGTFAWFTYSSKQSALVLTIGEINDTQIKLSPYQIKETITPGNTYTSGVYSEVEVVNGGERTTSVILYYKINQLDVDLIDKGLAYTIVDSSTGKNVKSGYFSDLIDTSKTLPDEVVILDESTSLGKTSNYKVYLWLDSSKTEQSELQNSSLDMELNGSIGSVSISGVNTYGQKLTANVVDTNTTATYTYQWYSNTTNSTTGGTAISGATGKEYTIGTGLVGKYIYVVANAVEDYYDDRIYTDVTDVENNTTSTVDRKAATLTVNPKTLNLTYPIADSTTISYTYDGDGTVTCNSADSNIATCTVNTSTKKVTVTPKSAAFSTTISLSASQGANYKATTSANVTVSVAKGTMTAGTVTISGNNVYSGTLTATVGTDTNPKADRYKYQWYSNTTNSTTGGTAISGATSSTYTVGTGVAGKYVYVVVTGEKQYYNNITFSDITDNVIAKHENQITATDKTIYVNATQDMSALVSNAKGTLTYAIKSQTTTGSSLSGKTLTAGVLSSSNDNNGTVVVTVTDSGGNDYSSSSVDVTITVQKYTRTLTWDSTTPTSVTYGDTSKKATVSVSGSGGTAGAVSYSSGGTSYLTINSSTGALTSVAYSTGVTITASLARTTTVKAASVTKSIAVARATGNITLSATSGTITYGTATKTFTVSSHHGGTLSATDNNSTATVAVSGSTVTISNLATLTAGTKVVVTVKSAQTTQYNEASATYTLTINKASCTCTISSASTDMKYPGSTNGTVNYSCGGDGDRIIVESSNTGVITVGSVGTTSTPLTGVGIGESSIKVSQEAGTNYNACTSASQSVSVAATTYQVSYDACSGSGAPSAQTKSWGVDMTISSTKPTRTGYTFQGWSTTGCNATSATHQAGGSYTTNASATMYAVWKSNTVYLYKNGNQYTSTTGGWSKVDHNNDYWDSGRVTINSSNIQMKASGSFAVWVGFMSKNKINLSNYSKLYVKFTNSSTSGNSSYCGFGLSKVRYFDDATYTPYVGYSRYGASQLSLSNVTGSYYIGVSCSVEYNGTATTQITEIYME